MVNQRQAIGNFLNSQKVKNTLISIHDHSSDPFVSDILGDGSGNGLGIWNPQLETQINVSGEGGERVDDIYKGKSFHAFTDGLNRWKSFRIPYNAKSNPEYDDKDMTFNLSEKVEGIGTTGWNWVKKHSEFVGFDFDSIIGHKAGLSAEEIDGVIERAKEIPWITLVRSKGGRGIHIFVFLDPVIPTENHTEHAALARSILSYLSALAQFDFNAKVDCCGGNMWIWHRSAVKIVSSKLELGVYTSVDDYYEKDRYAPFKLIKMGVGLDKVPPNWKDHKKVVSGKRRRVRDEDPTFNLLTSVTKKIPLDSEHKKLIDYLDKSAERTWWWDSDNHILSAHVCDLKEAHVALDMKGLFFTTSEGTDKEQNSFSFPMQGGAWCVRRYSQGIQEHPYWDTDAGGWTRCFLNERPTLQSLIRTYGGIEGSKGDFEFKSLKELGNAIKHLDMDLGIESMSFAQHRKAWLLPKKNQFLIATTVRESSDPEGAPGWRANKKLWEKVFKFSKNEADLETPDDNIRALVSNESFEAWFWKSANGVWTNQPKGNIGNALQARGYKKAAIDIVFGKAIDEPWMLVNKPFQPEYLGNRVWNKGAAQLSCTPEKPSSDAEKPHTWYGLLNHLGSALNDHLKIDEWAQENDVLTGGDYLKLWIACMFQFPNDKVPYLFFYSEERETGKTTFHEALKLLFKGARGVVRADVALTSSGAFNGELENGVLCVIEEVNLSKSNSALNRVKDYVTSDSIAIHKKGYTPYTAPNTTHWVQCANDPEYFPILPGDARVTVIEVNTIKNKLPRSTLFERLEQEAPIFLYEILNMEIPHNIGRLRIPVIATTDKINMEQDNSKNTILRWMKDNMHEVDGALVKFDELYEAFYKQCTFQEQEYWTRNMFSRSIPKNIAKGKYGPKRHVHIGNWSFNADEEESSRWVTNSKNELVKP